MSCKNCLVLIYFPSGSSCQIIIHKSSHIYVYTQSLLNNISTWLLVLYHQFHSIPGVPRILQQDHLLLPGPVAASQTAGLSVWVWHSGSLGLRSDGVLQCSNCQCPGQVCALCQSQFSLGSPVPAQPFICGAEIKISFDSCRNNETVNRSDQIYSGPSNNPHIGHAGLCSRTPVQFECFRYCKFPTAGKTAPGVKIKLEQHKNNEDPTSTGRRELVGYGRNIFMGYLNKDNDSKVRVRRRAANISVNVSVSILQWSIL